MFRFWRKHTMNIDTNLIEEEISRSRRFEQTFGLIILELRTSGSLGLGRLLPGKTISYQILKSHLRFYDKVIGPCIRRYCVLIPQTTKEGLAAAKKRLEALVLENGLGRSYIGYAFYPEDGDTAEQLIKKAMNLYNTYTIQSETDEGIA
jgi:hypothetical protein